MVKVISAKVRGRGRVRVGDRVRVHSRADETLPEEFVGLLGTVTRFVVTGQTGDTPDHPFVEVRFDKRIRRSGNNGRSKRAMVYHFWGEELIVPSPGNRR